MHRKIIKWGLVVLIFGIINSCDEGFLKSNPKDFRSPENAYVTMENFQAALNELYHDTRSDFFTSDNQADFPALAWEGTEEVYTHKNFGHRSNFGESILLPTNSNVVYGAMWHPAYSIIYDANTIIQQATGENNQLTDIQKTRVVAEAKFFRGYMYRMLANLYGGVPITLKPPTSPKRDYTRASRDSVYRQSAEDLKFAANNLPDIKKTGSAKVSNLAAYHELALTYICLKQWEKAVHAATVVISNPNTKLMTHRFGSMVDNPDFGGDVYWDLFRKNDQNRTSGNTEAIWVLQYEFDTPGGAGGGTNLQRMIVPRLWQAKIENNDGSLNPLIPYPNARYYGRGSGFMSPTHYLYNNIWQGSGEKNDIRNSKYNIVHDFKVDNPASDYDGQWVLKDHVPIHLKTFIDTARNYFPVFAKASTVGQFPQSLYKDDQTVKGSLLRATLDLRDRYVIRLAATYLLRAEAYLGENNKMKAAEDINVVRRRSKAALVAPSEVDMDYLLDERLRELNFESFRLLTLTRLGKLVERTRKYNPWVGDRYKEHNNLWPIPEEEIQKNINAKLKQNPGY